MQTVRTKEKENSISETKEGKNMEKEEPPRFFNNATEAGKTLETKNSDASGEESMVGMRRPGEPSQTASEGPSEQTPRVSNGGNNVPTEWNEEREQLLRKITNLETEIEMKDQQIQNDEETSGELLRELELKRHSIAELERENQKMREKVTSLKENIKKLKQSETNNGNNNNNVNNINNNNNNNAGIAIGSTKGSSVEMSEEDRKSSHSSVKNAQKVADTKYEKVQQSNKRLREENKTLKKN